jgi:Fungal fucose-specific lectin
MSSVAAVSWFKGTTTFLRVFTSNGSLVTEQVHDGQWHPGLFSVPGSSVTAAAWTDGNDVVQIRVFVANDGTIIEYQGTSDSEEWRMTGLRIEGMTAAAVRFPGLAGKDFLRVYVRDAGDTLREAYSNGEGWSTSPHFPSGKASTVAAVAWENSGTWNVRVFTTATGGNSEHRHIHAWASMPLPASGKVLTATNWADASGQMQMRLYTRGDNGDIVEWQWQASAWVAGPVIAKGVAASATAYRTPDGKPHIRLYVANAAGAVTEHAWDGGAWYPGIYPGALAPVEWWTEGGTLRQSLTTGAYLIRGVCYGRTWVGEDGGDRNSPVRDPLRSERAQTWQADLASMRLMHVNAIKVYDLVLEKKHAPFLDAAWHNGRDPIFVSRSGSTRGFSAIRRARPSWRSSGPPTPRWCGATRDIRPFSASPSAPRSTTARRWPAVRSRPTMTFSGTTS